MIYILRMINPDKLENIKVLGTQFSTPLRGISTLTVEADSERRETFELFISIAFLNFLPQITRK